MVVGGAAWLAAAYAAPAVSLVRARLSGPVTAALAVAYVLVLVVLAHVSAEAADFQRAAAGLDAGPAPSILNELLKPLRW